MDVRMSKINVLFVMPQMGMGGSERLVHSLMRKLDRGQFSPSLAWLSGAEALQEFRNLEVPLHYVPKTKRVDFSTMRNLARIIREEDIDVVCAQHFMPTVYAYYGSRLAADRALVFTAHSRWEIEGTPLKWRVAGGLMLRRICASVGVAPEVSNAIQRVFGLEARHIVTIQNGVDISMLAHRKDVQDLRNDVGLADGDRVIGIVANLKKVKNHLFLLQAFSKVVDEYRNAKLLIIGQGFPGESDNTEGALRQFVDDHRLGGNVLFLGYRTDVPALLQVMDVWCLTSLREGLPIGLIEAMASGLAVVSTNVEGSRDVIEHGKDGLLVECGNVENLAQTLIALLNDPALRRRLGAAAQRKAEEEYSLKRCIKEYEQLFLRGARNRVSPHNRTTA